MQIESLTQGKLLRLADLEFWKEYYNLRGSKVDWTKAFCDIIEVSESLDFDTEQVRGRGAWREPDGRICYNTGRKIIGEYDETRLYLKKLPWNIGLSEKPLDKETRLEIHSVIKNLNFETMRDAMYYMSWAVLAPFAGALPWRPAILVTGPTSSGKSTLAKYVSIPISRAGNWNGAETTPAFLRQHYGKDSCGINLDESDKKTKEEYKRIQDLFSMMRQSTSDDAPKSGKGSSNGKAITYAMRNMFMFDAISPEVENLADENRIFRINIIRPTNNWKSVRKDLVRLLNKKNCRAIRSLTWIKLKDILNTANLLTDIVNEVTGKSARRSYAESLLFSAYLIIWLGMDTVDEYAAEKILKDFYKDVELKKEIEDADELVDRLLDETVPLSESKTIKSFRQMLHDVSEELQDISDERNTLAQHGLALTNSTELAIHPNHHKIKKIIERGKGYNQILWRHSNLVSKGRSVRIDGKSPKCVIIGGMIEKEEKPVEEIEKIPSDLFEE
jgi:hypothetical protein